jgi:hypothetical protein
VTCRKYLDRIGALMSSYQAVVKEFNSCLCALKAYNSFLSLPDIERLIAPTALSVSIGRIQNSTGSPSFGFLSPYGGGETGNRPIDSLRALAPQTGIPSTPSSNDYGGRNSAGVSVARSNPNGVMMLAENYLALFEGPRGQNRHIVAGSHLQGNASNTRQLSRFKNPESVCTFSYVNGSGIMGHVSYLSLITPLT